jgi:hypothetical protein
MNGTSFLNLMKNPKCKNAFGKVTGLGAIKRRLSEERLFPTYNEPVNADNAAKMIMYAIICPAVANPYANAIIQQYELQFQNGFDGKPRDMEKTSMGYLIKVLSGSEAIPYQIKIESHYGSISVDKIHEGRIIADANFWPGRFDKVPQKDGWPEKTVLIPGKWLEMLRDKIKAGLDEYTPNPEVVN